MEFRATEPNEITRGMGEKMCSRTSRASDTGGNKQAGEGSKNNGAMNEEPN